MSESLTFFKRVFSSSATQILGMGLAFVGSVLLARQLGADDRGVVAWIMSLHVIGSAMAQSGMCQVNRRFAADGNIPIDILKTLSILACFTASVMLIPLLYLYATNFDIAHNKLALTIGLIGIPCLSTADALCDLLIAQHKTRRYNIINFVQKLVSVSIILALVAGGIANITFAVTAYILGSTTKLIIAVFLAGAKFEFNIHKAMHLFHRIKSYMFANEMSLLALLFASHVNIILLGMFSTSSEVGMYAVSMTLIEAMIILPKMTGVYIIPRLAKTSEHKNKNLIINQTVIISSIIMILIALPCFFLAQFGIHLLFGSEFDGAIPVFKIQLIGMVFWGIFIILHSIIIAEEDGWKIILPAFVSAVVIVLGSVSQYSAGGAVSAATVWALAQFAGLLVSVCLIFLKKVDKIAS
jgi:O-antigen/teichoic acid export membrane protein